MFWLKYIQGLLSTLNEDVSPNEIASGIVLGAAIGLLPKGNLTVLGIAFVIWICKVNKGMAGAAIFLFAMLGFLTDPFTEKLGFFLLSGVSALKGLWTFLFNLPIVPFTAFNNTLVMGNLIFSFLIAVPLFLLSRQGVVIYREHYRERVLQSPVMKFFKISNYIDLLERWRHRK